MTVVNLENKRKKKKIGSLKLESSEQIALVDWLKIMKIPHYAIINEGKREKFLVKNKRGEYRWVCPEGNKFKRMGLTRDISDICIPIPRKGYNGLYMELKTKNGFLRAGQAAWLRILTNFGYLAVEARPDSEAYIRIVGNYLGKWNPSEILEDWRIIWEENK